MRDIHVTMSWITDGIWLADLPSIQKLLVVRHNNVVAVNDENAIERYLVNGANEGVLKLKSLLGLPTLGDICA